MEEVANQKAIHIWESQDFIVWNLNIIKHFP